MYYLRTRPAVQAIQFTVDQIKLRETRKEKPETVVPEEKVNILWFLVKLLVGYFCRVNLNYSSVGIIFFPTAEYESNVATSR